MKRIARVALVLMLALFVAGASCQQQIKTPDKMTPKERGALALTLYNNAFNNYNAQFAATPQPMSAAMKDYFRGYKAAMEVAWPTISGYTAIVGVGGVPTPEQEKQIIALIYQLQAMLMQAGGAK
jgi:hypothetical protein